jgi:hypothetical protein
MNDGDNEWIRTRQPDADMRYECFGCAARRDIRDFPLAPTRIEGIGRYCHQCIERGKHLRRVKRLPLERTPNPELRHSASDGVQPAAPSAPTTAEPPDVLGAAPAIASDAAPRRRPGPAAVYFDIDNAVWVRRRPDPLGIASDAAPAIASSNSSAAPAPAITTDSRAAPAIASDSAAPAITNDSAAPAIINDSAAPAITNDVAVDAARAPAQAPRPKPRRRGCAVGFFDFDNAVWVQKRRRGRKRRKPAEPAAADAREPSKPASRDQSPKRPEPAAPDAGAEPAEPKARRGGWSEDEVERARAILAELPRLAAQAERMLQCMAKFVNGANARNRSHDHPNSNFDVWYLLEQIARQRGRCAYTGAELDFFGESELLKASLERPLTALPYSRDNAIFIIWPLNTTDRNHGAVFSTGNSTWTRAKAEAVHWARAQPVDQEALRTLLARLREPPAIGEPTGLCAACGQLADLAQLHLQNGVSACQQCIYAFLHHMVDSVPLRSADTDLTYAWLEAQLLRQAGRCAKTRIPLVLRSHTHWQCSLHRVDRQRGWYADNCVLVCLDFNGSYAWSPADIDAIFPQPPQ